MPPPTPPRLTLRLAAAPEARTAEGRALPLAPVDAALLAWLALEGATPRARLAALLWPASEAAAAANALRQRLFKLRRGLGDVVAGSSVLALAPGVDHDLHDADTVLDGQAPDVGEEFAAWLRLQRERRQQRVRQSLVELADMAERSGDWADALGLARELLALEPLSEAAHRRVMRLHYLAGDRAAALLAFDACERMLKDEVGAPPSPPTLELLALVEASALPVAVAAVPAAVLRPPRLVGRDALLQQLQGLIDARALVAVAGEGGQGKSRLLAQLAQMVAPALVVTARPGEAQVPYALAAKLLRALRARDGVDDTAWREDLAVVLPECGRPPPGPRDRVRLVGATAALVAQATAAGLRLLAVDDLQFADTASIELLAAASAERGCAWLLALRPHELPPAAQVWLSALEQDGGCARVDLPPLDLAATQALLASLALPGLDDAAEGLHRRTGGNPMFLLETVKAGLPQPGRALAVAGALPSWPRVASVQRVIQQRLQRLSPGALKLVRCAAVAGPDLSAALVADVLGLAPLDQADAWAELEAAQVLRDQAFAHDLIAEAAAGLVPAPVARPLHAAVAVHLETREGEPIRIAGHWTAAGEPRRAVPHLMAAATRADALARPDLGAPLMEQAARTLAAAGEREAAFDAWFGAMQMWHEVEDGGPHTQACVAAMEALVQSDAQQALCALAQTPLLLEQRRADEALALVQRALPLAERSGTADAEVELLWDLVVLHWERRELAEAAAFAERALQALPRVDPATARVRLRDTRLKLVNALGVLANARGQLPEARRYQEQTYAQAIAERALFAAHGAADQLLGAALDAGDLATARHWVERRDADVGARLTQVSETAPALGHRLLLHLMAGELGTALMLADQGLQLAQVHRFRHSLVLSARCHALQHALGRTDLALKGLRALRDLPQATPVEALTLDALALACGAEGAGAADVIDRLAALPDMLLRARLLCWAAAGCPGSLALPLLHVTTMALRDQGAHGLWLLLEAERARALARLGRGEEAALAAETAWRRMAEGVAPRGAWPETAAALAEALTPGRPALADGVAAQGCARMLQAAATLPPGWREVYLERRGRAVVGLP